MILPRPRCAGKQVNSTTAAWFALKAGAATFVSSTLVALLTLIGSPAAASSPAEVVAGRVVRVFDGDSFILRAGRRDVEVRLADIDAPEKGQPYADQARRALMQLVEGRDVRAEVREEDRYRRKIARLYRNSDGLDVNAELVRRGHAWAYNRYVRDQTLIALEQQAKKTRAGLWGLPVEQQVPPWQYRYNERRAR